MSTMDTDSVTLPVPEEKTPKTEEELSSEASEKDGSRVDLPRFRKAFAAFVAKLPSYGEAILSMQAIRAELADLLMEVRLSVLLQDGTPDYYGKTWTYRFLFQDRIVATIRKETGWSDSFITKTLDTVRVQYVNGNDMVSEIVVKESVRNGSLEKVRGVKSAKLVKDGDVEKVVITTDKDKQVTYTPGQTANVPAAIASVVRKVAEDNGKIVKPRFGGKTKPRAAVVEPKIENPAEKVRDGLALMVGMANVAPLEVVAGLHETCTMLADRLLGAPGEKAPEEIPGGREAVSDALIPVSELVKTLAAALVGRGTKEKVQEYRYTAPDA